MTMPSASAAITGSRSGRNAGTVAVSICMVVATVVMTIMVVDPFFGAVLYRTDRTAGINCLYPSAMMSMCRYGHDKKRRNQCRSQCRSKQFFQAHDTHLLSQIPYVRVIIAYAGCFHKEQNRLFPADSLRPAALLQSAPQTGVLFPFLLGAGGWQCDTICDTINAGQTKEENR